MGSWCRKRGTNGYRVRHGLGARHSERELSNRYRLPGSDRGIVDNEICGHVALDHARSAAGVATAKRCRARSRGIRIPGSGNGRNTSRGGQRRAWQNDGAKQASGRVRRGAVGRFSSRPNLESSPRQVRSNLSSPRIAGCSIKLESHLRS